MKKLSVKIDFDFVFLFMAAALLAFVFASGSLLEKSVPAAADKEESIRWDAILDDIFEKRDEILLMGNTGDLAPMYVPGERNSRWAQELEEKRVKYLKDWAARQGVRFTGISSDLVVKNVKKVGRGYAFYVVVSSSYTYVYEDTPGKENFFRIGTYHSLDLIPGKVKGSWVISREWYLDPFQDSLNRKTLENDEIKQFILAGTERDFSDIFEGRKKAVNYADRYAGVASDGRNGYSYNPDYPNYNGRGGDCSNYVSQALHEGAFKTDGGWNHSGNSATRSWCNASGLQSYLIWSGKGYEMARGTYSQVYKTAYELIPGDAIAFVEKGKVVHMAIVTGADSKGYPLVNTHTTDRYHVPWDLGWNDSDIKFILIKMNYPF